MSNICFMKTCGESLADVAQIFPLAEKCENKR